MICFCKMVISAAVTSVICYGLVLKMPLRETDKSFFVTFPKFCLISMTSVLVYFGLSRAFKLDEAQVISQKIKRLILPKPEEKQ